jgi:cysteine synthase
MVETTALEMREDTVGKVDVLVADVETRGNHNGGKLGNQGEKAGS